VVLRFRIGLYNPDFFGVRKNVEKNPSFSERD
jgi:hypothetical protein